MSFLDSIPKCPVDIVLPTVTLHIIAYHIWFISLCECSTLTTDSSTIGILLPILDSIQKCPVCFFLVTHRDSTLLHFTFGSFPLRVSEVLPSWPWFYTAPPKGGPGPPFEILGPPFHKPRGGPWTPPLEYFLKNIKEIWANLKK